MEISYREKLRRCLMIQGAYFKPHVMERAEERLGISDFPVDRFEQKLIDLEGDLFYDEKHDNYQLVLEDLAFAFGLKLHPDRSGLLAYVLTTVSTPNDYRDGDDRFERLRPEDYDLTEHSEIALKKIIDRSLKTSDGDSK